MDMLFMGVVGWTRYMFMCWLKRNLKTQMEMGGDTGMHGCLLEREQIQCSGFGKVQLFSVQLRIAKAFVKREVI